ncbi:glycosyltransferase family 39 protein [Planobispora longispora]|uniref:glycosyltransferase family 39 protein n=1 Tax=Planobispora longispora TaxID=28887 RepID=UPI0019416BC6|nr:glycosyltransferase family 39 protein [Planobispora longispora]
MSRTADDSRLGEIPAFARRHVTVVSLVLFTLLVSFSPGYGYHRDELYFRMLGEHPAWGYVDQPPLTPLLARASTALFGDLLVAVRAPAALSAAILVVLVALTARELGGGRTAQLLAAAGVGTGVFTLIAGHSLLTLSADLPLWTAAVLFILRALLRGDGRWWLAAGTVIGLATYNRHLIALLVIGLAAGLLGAGPRETLRSPWLWAGALLAVALATPNLLYQVANGWPQLEMAAALSEDKGAEFRILYLPMQLVLFGPVAAVLGAVGWLRLRRNRRVRSLAVAYPVAAALTLLSGGRFDYTAGLIVLLAAAGCVSAEEWAGRRAGRLRTVVIALSANGVLSAVIALPLIPVTALSATPVPYVNEVARESVGWEEFASRVAAVVRGLPAEERARTVLLAGSYGEAGMLHLAAGRYGLPAVYSGHNHLHLYGPPPESATVAVAVKMPRRLLETRFAECAEAGRTDNGVGVENEFQDLPIFVCRGLREPWRTAWPRFQHYS